MSLPELITFLKAFFQFPDALLALVKILQQTPEEKHEDLIKAIDAEKQKFTDTGRPTWH